jgi:hypothetical protein
VLSPEGYPQRTSRALPASVKAVFGVSLSPLEREGTHVSTSYGVLSTYPPTQCGLATFTSALVQSLRSPADVVGVVDVVDVVDDVDDVARVDMPERTARARTAAAVRVFICTWTLERARPDGPGWTILNPL